MKRAALYVRVSTEEQKKHGLSVDSQIVALREYCANNNLEEMGLYNDAGISARKKYTKRPELLKLISDCQAGKVDVIIFTKLDRWFRSVADYYEVQSKLDSYKVPWRAIWEDYETETSSGVFKVNIMLSVAQSEADRTSERIKRVNEYKRERGDYVGSAPTGYLVNGKNLIKNPAQEPGLNAFFKEYMVCHNVRMSLLKAREYGLNISKCTAIRLLTNPVYVGDAFGGYSCEPYLTQDEWDIIQNTRNVCIKEHYEKKVRNYIFNGITICGECGGAYCGSIRRFTNYNKKYVYKYYRCRCHQDLRCTNQKSITEMKLERYLIDTIDEELKNYTISADLTYDDLQNNEGKIKTLEAKLERIGERYEDGEIDRNTYKKKRADIINQIETLKCEISKKNAPRTPLPANWLAIYNELDDIHKRMFWAGTLNHITIHKDGRIEIIL